MIYMIITVAIRFWVRILSVSGSSRTATRNLHAGARFFRTAWLRTGDCGFVAGTLREGVLFNVSSSE